MTEVAILSEEKRNWKAFKDNLFHNSTCRMILLVILNACITDLFFFLI